ncbi:cytochrome P450 [Sorangium cellulosum]|uniref:Cytochrome P450 n=1 Tax=Sorangium cellulosum TaxID=56 RepID=A0A2L0EK04_SORCE|nr:cytochrome P450 [Sorangium cellulosum]AUX39635.1 cytochrome P450 [Sorangium cellulosum]
MMQQSSRPTVEFNPFAPGYTEDPYPVYARLREAPLRYWEEGRGWIASRHSEIQAILRDDRFTANRAAWAHAPSLDVAGIAELEELNRHSLFSLPDRDHARVRKLVSPALTPRAVERLRPRIQRIVDERLDAIAGKRVIDVVHDFSEHIPVRVISSMLHIPEEHDAAFHRFADAAVKQLFMMLLSPQEIERMVAGIREGTALLGGVIEERRRSPIEGDMLTSLIQSEEQGDRLSKPELVSLVTALLVGGSETTVHLIAFMVLNLLKRPEVLAEVQRDPELIKGVVEEVLRFDNFGKFGTFRYATEDVEIGGARIAKGEMVMLFFSAALRDEAAYADPDRFDPRRDATASLAFGGGAHYCIGANLARLEGQIAVSSLLRRFPGMKIESPPTFGPHPAIRKMDSFKVRLEA